MNGGGLISVLTGCLAPPPGELYECNDQVYPSLLGPFLAVMLAVAIVALVVMVARRGELPTRGGVILVSLVAVVAITTASWAGTHDFLYNGHNCSAVGPGVRPAAGASPALHDACVAHARRAFGGAVGGAAVSLLILWVVARERVPDGAMATGSRATG
jgi:hypothetical protein